jgi:hypothetical protein
LCLAEPDTVPEGISKAIAMPVVVAALVKTPIALTR